MRAYTLPPPVSVYKQTETLAHTHFKYSAVSDSNFHRVRRHLGAFFIQTVCFLLSGRPKGRKGHSVFSASLCSSISGTYPRGSKGALQRRDDTQCSGPSRMFHSCTMVKGSTYLENCPHPEIKIAQHIAG